jgi:hypothetical protein
MDRIDKIKLALSKGITYDPLTGDVKNKKGLIYKSRLTNGYLVIKMVDKKNQIVLLSHHFAWYCIYNEIVKEIDHINNVRDDNRIINLRSVTSQENKFNNSKAKGYSFYKRSQKWKSRIKINGIDIHLGYFETELEARMSYLKAKEKYHIIKS